MNTGRELKRPSKWWWLYFVFCCLMTFLALAFFFPKDPRLAHIAMVSSSIDLCAIAGLAFYILSMRVLIPFFWQLVFLASLVKASVATHGFLSILFAYPGVNSPGQRIALAGLGGVLAGVPLLFAIGKYGYFSRHVWRAPEKGPAA
jgi:hypothetical protein